MKNSEPSERRKGQSHLPVHLRLFSWVRAVKREKRIKQLKWAYDFWFGLSVLIAEPVWRSLDRDQCIKAHFRRQARNNSSHSFVPLCRRKPSSWWESAELLLFLFCSAFYLASCAKLENSVKMAFMIIFIEFWDFYTLVQSCPHMSASSAGEPPGRTRRHSTTLVSSIVHAVNFSVFDAEPKLLPLSLCPMANSVAEQSIGFGVGLHFYDSNWMVFTARMLCLPCLERRWIAVNETDNYTSVQHNTKLEIGRASCRERV